MITCWLHQSALRRHFDDGTPISPRVKTHLDQCPRCRETFQAQTEVLKTLRAQKPAELEVPLFLHARVMNAIQAEARPTRALWVRFAWAMPALIVACVVAISLRPTREKGATVHVQIVPRQVALKTSIPENPLEAEIQNLRADTMNAARALASAFVPSDSLPRDNR